MIDHSGFNMSKPTASRTFYEKALAPLHYYGAFVLDPDGHNVEAVCHDPQ